MSGLKYSCRHPLSYITTYTTRIFRSLRKKAESQKAISILPEQSHFTKGLKSMSIFAKRCRAESTFCLKDVQTFKGRPPTLCLSNVSNLGKIKKV